MTPILDALREFVLRYAERRKAEGRAEFHDLLVWARDLLRDDLQVRDYFRARYSHVLIDEVQDTDPIQTEMAMFLSEAVPEGGNNGPRPSTWDQVLPETGKLFVVGDAKQSIFPLSPRRRCADEQAQGPDGAGRWARAQPGAELQVAGPCCGLGESRVRAVDGWGPRTG